MPCIHGLDEINCPTCRIIRFTLPENEIKIKSQTTIKAEYPFFQANSKDEENLIKELRPNLPAMHKHSINMLSPPNLLNELPNFENRMLLERIKQIGVSKSSIFDLSKKHDIASPELKLNKEEKSSH